MNRFFLTTFLLLSLQNAHAASFEETKLPTAVKASIPQGDTIWLARQEKQQRAYLVFHGTLVPKQAGVGGQGKDYRLDVWQEEKNGKLRQVRSVALPRKLFEEVALEKVAVDTWIRAEFLWLRPRNKQSPLLLLSFTVHSGAGINLFRKDLALVFPGGFKSKPIVQEFYGHTFREEDIQHLFHQVDRAGFLQVTKLTEASNGGYTPPSVTTTILRWNGHEFATADATNPSTP